MNKQIMQAAGLGEHVKLVEQGLCPTCSKPIKEDEFRDELSKREFKISGMCQECQDKIFGKD